MKGPSVGGRSSSIASTRSSSRKLAAVRPAQPSRELLSRQLVPPRDWSDHRRSGRKTALCGWRYWLSLLARTEETLAIATDSRHRHRMMTKMRRQTARRLERQIVIRILGGGEAYLLALSLISLSPVEVVRLENGYHIRSGSIFSRRDGSRIVTAYNVSALTKPKLPSRSHQHRHTEARLRRPAGVRISLGLKSWSAGRYRSLTASTTDTVTLWILSGRTQHYGRVATRSRTFSRPEPRSAGKKTVPHAPTPKSTDSAITSSTADQLQ